MRAMAERGRPTRGTMVRRQRRASTTSPSLPSSLSLSWSTRRRRRDLSTASMPPSKMPSALANERQFPNGTGLPRFVRFSIEIWAPGCFVRLESLLADSGLSYDLSPNVRVVRHILWPRSDGVLWGIGEFMQLLVREYNTEVVDQTLTDLNDFITPSQACIKPVEQTNKPEVKDPGAASVRLSLEHIV